MLKGPSYKEGCIDVLALMNVIVIVYTKYAEMSARQFKEVLDSVLLSRKKHIHPWQMHVDAWQNQYNIVK